MKAATREKAESANSLPFVRLRVFLCMGAYKCNVVVAIKMGAYIHGVLVIPILRQFVLDISKLE